jgi:hypothetical protein
VTVIKREAYRRVSKLITDAIRETGIPIVPKIPDQVAQEMRKIATAMTTAGGIEDLPELESA